MNIITYNPSFIETIESSTICENGICYSYPIKHAICNDESLSNCKGLGRFEELSVPFWYGHKKIPSKPKHYKINYSLHHFSRSGLVPSKEVGTSDCLHWRGLSLV